MTKNPKNESASMKQSGSPPKSNRFFLPPRSTRTTYLPENLIKKIRS